MNTLTVETSENYIRETYRNFKSAQSMFMKLAEEIGELQN